MSLLFQTKIWGKANLSIKFGSLGIIGYIFRELTLLAEGLGQFPMKRSSLHIHSLSMLPDPVAKGQVLPDLHVTSW